MMGLDAMILIFWLSSFKPVFSLNILTRCSSAMAQWVKNPPAMQESQETQVPSLCQEDPLEEEMETHSIILAWKIPWTEEPGRL